MDHAAAQSIEWGEGYWIDFSEDLVEDIWAMVARGLSVATMTQWYYSTTRRLGRTMKGQRAGQRVFSEKAG